MNAAKAMRLLATANMRPFDKTDWEAFAGCESENPLIGEAEAFILIVDGNRLEVIEADQTAHAFTLRAVAI